MPFQYTAVRSPYVGSIGDLIAREGEIRARAAQESGQAWAGATQNIGNTVASTVAKVTDPAEQMKRTQVSDLSALDKAFSQPGGRDAILASLPGHLRPQVASSFASADENAAKVNEANLKAEAATTDYVTGLAEKIKAHDYDPAAMQLALSHAKQTFASNPSLLGQLAPMEAALQANPTPDTVRALVDPIMKAHDAQKAPVKLAGAARPGAAPETLVREDGTVLASGASAGPAPITNEVELTQDANNPQSPTAAQSKRSLDMLRAAEAGKRAPVGGELKFGRVDGQGPVIGGVFRPDTNKVIVNGELMDPSRFQAPTDPAERQAASVAAQIAQQQRSQDFETKKQARSDIDKINKDFLTARTSADTLRDVVSSAQSGNKVAGSLQSLEATMAAIRAQGLNRINTAEIGVTADAGNAWDRIVGWFGKKVDGQPVPPNIQKDMQQFADILDKAAFKKYGDAHDATNTLYGTSIPRTFTAPASPDQGPPAPVGLTPGLQRLQDR